jgi:MerR family mercuric resistance operon transcriptional regulator
MSNNDDPRPCRDAAAFRAEPAADEVLSIDKVARMFGISRLTLRHYEIRGLIKRQRRAGRTRVYSWADCERLAFILKARRAGLALSDVMSILAAADDVLADRKTAQEQCLELIARLERRRRAFDEGIAELQHVHAQLGGKPTGGSGENTTPSREE